MATKAKVAILRTKPETALEDYERLMHMADVTQALDPSATENWNVTLLSVGLLLSDMTTLLAIIALNGSPDKMIENGVAAGRSLGPNCVVWWYVVIW